MTFIKTVLEGVYIVEPDPRIDDRGFYARAWCRREFEDHDLSSTIEQVNISLSWKKGTLRGLHYQIPPYEETKLVRCVRGAIYDVIVDLRPGSSSYLQWMGEELRSSDYRMIYVPEGCAHGFLTLDDESEVIYQVSREYVPAAERGLRYNDPDIAIQWPAPVEVISFKDLQWPDFNDRGGER